MPPQWGRSTYEVTRRQMSMDSTNPWTIAVVREDEPLMLAPPRGATTFSSSIYFCRSAFWWMRLNLSRHRKRLWRVIVFDLPPQECESVADAIQVEEFTNLADAADRASVLQSTIGDVIRRTRESPGS